MIRQEVHGGYATNVASVGGRTEEVLRLQENVTLGFNVAAFKADYEEALRVAYPLCQYNVRHLSL